MNISLDGLAEGAALPGCEAFASRPEGTRSIMVDWWRDGERVGTMTLLVDEDTKHFTVNNINVPPDLRTEGYFGLIITGIWEWSRANGFKTASGYGTDQMRMTLWRLGLEPDPDRPGHMTADLTRTDTPYYEYIQWRRGKKDKEPKWRAERRGDLG